MPRGPSVELEELVVRFAGRQVGFRRFHAEFIDLFVHRETELPSADRKRWSQVYGLVCMAIPDPVRPEHHALGILGEEELRARLAPVVAAGASAGDTSASRSR